ncbi:MAG TPA: transporter [Candidatus Angelobacter sp.]|nr:transporter [Candidatus Angelobacter sp.]
MLMCLRRIRALLVLCIWGVSFCRPAHAHDSEPINTDFASPLARHTANLNFDLQHFRSSPDEDLAGIDFEYGIARRMQFSLGMPMSRHVSAPAESVIGAGNLSFEYRYLIAGGNEKPFALSINPEAEFPTGNPGASDRAYALGAALHLDAHRGDKLWLHSNWGYSTPVARFDEKEKDFNFAVAGMYEVTEKWHSVLEVFGQHDFNSSVSQMFVAPELIYSLAEHWELKAAVPFGVTSSTPSVGLQFRLTWKIGPAERQ